jgi:hypothetical protein
LFPYGLPVVWSTVHPPRDAVSPASFAPTFGTSKSQKENCANYLRSHVTHKPPRLSLVRIQINMSDGRKAVVKNADMSEDMQHDAVDAATQALEKYNVEKVRLFSCCCQPPDHFLCDPPHDSLSTLLHRSPRPSIAERFSPSERAECASTLPILFYFAQYLSEPYCQS